MVTKNTIQKIAGSPLGGSSPNSRRMIGSGSTIPANSPITTAPRCLPSVRLTTGDIAPPMAAERNTLMVISPICSELKPQK